MNPRNRLEQLQHKCKGLEKENLYDLIGVQGARLDHEELLKRLVKKQDAWGKMANKAAELDIIDKALELLKTPADKAEYDRFLNQQPWGSFGPIKLFARLAMFAAGIAMLMQLTTGLLNRLNSPTTTPSRAPSESGAEAEGGGAPGGASTRTERETASSTSTERSGTTATSRRETAPSAAVTAPVPAPNPPGTRPTAAPARRAPSRNTSGARAAQPQATAAPAVEVVEPARPDPPPVVEPVRVGGNVPQPRKTWNVTPEYPRLARLRRIQGIVILEVTVDRQGDVSNVSVLRSAEDLDQAAVEAVRQWRYEPTIVNGRPVSIIFTETVRFQI